MRRCPGFICLRNRLTAERYGRRAAALPHSRRTKLLVNNSAREFNNCEKHACAARCHWSLSSQTARRPTVSRNTVMAGAHRGGTPRHVRLTDTARLISSKCRPKHHHDPPFWRPGGAQTPPRCVRGVRPLPMAEIPRVHILHGSSSQCRISMPRTPMPVCFPGYWRHHSQEIGSVDCSLDLVYAAGSLIADVFLRRMWVFSPNSRGLSDDYQF
jgi:hypothetical protein